MRPIEYQVVDRKTKQVLGYERVYGGSWQVTERGKETWGDFGTYGGDCDRYQFTGFQDSKSRNIYEGAIVDYGGIEYVITWIEAALVAFNPEYPLHYLNKEKCGEMKLTGNIWRQ